VAKLVRIQIEGDEGMRLENETRERGTVKMVLVP
jgi:hypothetical protein